MLSPRYRIRQFFAWGWRVPFLLSIALIGVGLFIRLRILESPSFSRVKELGVESKVPLLEVLRDYLSAAVLAIGMVLIVMGGYYIVTTFTLSYITGSLGVPRNVALKGLLVAGAAQTAGILIFSWVADRVGTRLVAIWSAACIFLLSYPYFWLVDTRRPALIWLAMGVWMFADGSLYGITGVYLAGLFPARVRYSGISFSYQMAGMLGGALAPIISTALIQWAGGASWPVATYLAITAFISLVAVYLASDRYRVKIDETAPIERRLASEHG